MEPNNYRVPVAKKTYRKLAGVIPAWLSMNDSWSSARDCKKQPL